MKFEPTKRNKKKEVEAVIKADDPITAFNQTRAKHKASIARIKGDIADARLDIRRHKLLIKQAKTVYKLEKLKR